MSAFFADLGDNPFLLTGLVAGWLAALACGVIGPYVVTRRIVFLAGAVAHVAVGGIGAAVWAAWRWPRVGEVLGPLGGATLAAVAAALVLAAVHARFGDRLDTVVGALWAAGMAVGILLVKLTPGYHAELMSYLFGNLVFVPWSTVVWMAILDVVILAMVVLFHKRFVALCLDPQQAALQGIPVLATDAVLLVLVALTVVLVTHVVGLILVLALLTLPAAVAGHHVRRLPAMMATATVLGALLTTGPRILVYGSELSPEPAIVLAAAAVYLVSAGVVARRRAVRRRRPTSP